MGMDVLAIRSRCCMENWLLIANKGKFGLGCCKCSKASGIDVKDPIIGDVIKEQVDSDDFVFYLPPDRRAWSLKVNRTNGRASLSSIGDDIERVVFSMHVPMDLQCEICTGSYR